MFMVEYSCGYFIFWKGAILQMNNWTPEQDKLLEDMNSKGLSLKTMAARLNRTENAVRLRVKHLGFSLNVRGRRWTKEEEANFRLNWLDETMNNDALVRRHNRTWHALQEKAVSMKLGPRPYNSCYLSIRDICSEMQVSSDRVYRWIKFGLKTHKGGSKRRKYLVSADDLLAFLKEHSTWFLASKVDTCLFCSDRGEPKWLLDKRSFDRKHDRSRHQLIWSNQEDAKLYQMFNSGATIEELAMVFQRSYSAIRTHLYVIGCEIKRTDVYTDEELDILKKYSDTKTLYELASMLKGRSVKGIEYKCKMLKLPYHFSKTQCKSEDFVCGVCDVSDDDANIDDENDMVSDANDNDEENINDIGSITHHEYDFCDDMDDADDAHEYGFRTQHTA